MGTSKRKPDGWWSRRHRTREAQDTARERYQAEHGPAARRRKAADRVTGTPPFDGAPVITSAEVVGSS